MVYGKMCVLHYWTPIFHNMLSPDLCHGFFWSEENPVTIDNFSIVGREDQNLKRAIKEALYIRRNNPSLNKKIGKYHLSHIWDEALVNITELQVNITC